MIPEKVTEMTGLWARLSTARGAGAFYLIVLVAWLALSTLTVACERVHGPARETHAVDPVRVLLTALAKFRDAYPAQGYPEALKDLGPGPTGRGSNSKTAGLIDAELASGIKNGYRFFYIPGTSTAGGAIISFAITARPLKYEGTGTPSFFADQTGIIRQTTEDRAATDADAALQNE